MEPQSKECRECGETKPLEEFHVDRRGIGGRKAICRDCRNSDRRKQSTSSAHPGNKIKRSDEFMELRKEISSLFQRLNAVMDLVDNKDFENMDNTDKVDGIKLLIDLKFSDLREKYKRVLDPLINEFNVLPQDINQPLYGTKEHSIRTCVINYFNGLPEPRKVLGVPVEVNLSSGFYNLLLPDNAKICKKEFTNILRSANLVLPTYIYS